MTEQDNRPAWEQLCPELPPKCRIIPVEVDDAPGRLGVMLFGSSLFVNTREEAASRAWALFTRYTGITKKQWAELIAPRLVRDAARCLPAVVGVDISHRNGAVVVKVIEGGMGDLVHTAVRGEGPTLCDAALAVIRTLGEAE
jgi:hypothetical protein